MARRGALHEYHEAHVSVRRCVMGTRYGANTEAKKDDIRTGHALNPSNNWYISDCPSNSRTYRSTNRVSNLLLAPLALSLSVQRVTGVWTHMEALSMANEVDCWRH